MKVYFEVSGWYGKYRDITVYIKPTKKGSKEYQEGHHYTPFGELVPFTWVSIKKSLSVNRKEIPKELWFTFKHGENVWRLDNKYEFTIENILKYAEVPIRTIEEVRAEKKLQNIKFSSEQDIIDNLSLLNKCGYIPDRVSDEIFKIAKIKKLHSEEGEIGIDNLYGSVCISAYLEYLEKKIYEG